MHRDRSRFLNTLEQARQKTGNHLTGKVSGLERVLEISRQIATLQLDKALELIVTHILELTGARRGMVMLRDDEGKLRFQYGEGLDRDEVESGEFEISRSVTHKAMDENKVQIIEDVPTSGFKDQRSIVRLGLRAIMVIPLQGRGQVIGVIYVDTDDPRHSMSVKDTTILNAFGSQAAVSIENARLHQRVQEDYLFLKDAPVTPKRFGQIVYQSRAMYRVHHAIKQVMDNNVTVLVNGESGTGKELVAHAIHYQGQRRNKQFVTQNTGALPDTLLESELFGHRRGAFSGAVNDKAGIFEIADGGTVFLDEIGEASPAMQVRLLRFLETRRFRRVGDTVERSTDVRIIAATHRDLMEEVKKGNFREDLYYRLSVFPINLAPLRERRKDIPLLIHHFVDIFNKELNKSVKMIPQRMMKMLQDREWKGNIRELKNHVNRLMVLSQGEELAWPEGEYVPKQDDAAESEVEAAVETFKTLEEMERDYILYVLKKLDGNQSKAAGVLGLKRTTFISRLKKLGIME